MGKRKVIDNKNNIEGWLFVPLGAVAYILLKAILDTIECILTIISVEPEVISQNTTQFRPLFFSGMAYSIMAILAIITIRKYMKKEKKAIRWVIFIAIGYLLIALIGLYLISLAVPGTIKFMDVVKWLRFEILILGIIPYMIMSKKVKETFTS